MKKSKTMRTAIREHERKWMRAAPVPRGSFQRRTPEHELML